MSSQCAHTRQGFISLYRGHMYRIELLKCIVDRFALSCWWRQCDFSWQTCCAILVPTFERDRWRTPESCTELQRKLTPVSPKECLERFKFRLLSDGCQHSWNHLLVNFHGTSLQRPYICDQGICSNFFFFFSCTAKRFIMSSAFVFTCSLVNCCKTAMESHCTWCSNVVWSLNTFFRQVFLAIVNLLDSDYLARVLYCTKVLYI